MACLKIAITVPEEIVTQVDAAARKRGGNSGDRLLNS
jgi:hypothetical protein